MPSWTEPSGASRGRAAPCRALRAFALIALALIGLQPAHAQDLDWNALRAGLEVAAWSPGDQCAEAVPILFLVRVDPERFRFDAYHFADERLSAPVTTHEWQERSGAVVVFNAGLFREDYSYMGLLYKGGRSLGSKRHPHWHGLFAAEPFTGSARKARVMDLAKEPFREQAPAYRVAAQSLMLLDQSGKPRVRRTGKRAQQMIVAEDQAGRIVLIKTSDAVGLWELADCLSKALPEVRQAMAMDGGSSADLLIARAVAEDALDRGEMPPWGALVDGAGTHHIALPAVIAVLPR